MPKLSSLFRSNQAHERLSMKAFKESRNAKTPESIVISKTKHEYHKSSKSWQEKLNRRLNKKEKKQLFRAFNNYHRSSWGLPEIKYKNQPNYINFK